MNYERIPSEGSTRRGGLEYNEHGTIPFVDKRISILRTSWVVAGKSDEGVSIDVNRLHVICPVRLKRLQFDEMYPWQFEDTELNFCLTSHGTVSCYLRGLDELDVISFVDDSFCWVGTSIMMACYARYSSSFITKNLRCAAPSFGNLWNTTNCCPLIIVYHCTAVSISKYKYILQSHKEIWRYSFELA